MAFGLGLNIAKKPSHLTFEVSKTGKKSWLRTCVKSYDVKILELSTISIQTLSLIFKRLSWAWNVYSVWCKFSLSVRSKLHVAPAMPQDLRTTPFKMFVFAQESELNSMISIYKMSVFSGIDLLHKERDFTVSIIDSWVSFPPFIGYKLMRADVPILAHLSHWLIVSYCDPWSSIVNNYFKGHLLNYWLDFYQTFRNDHYIALFNNCSNRYGPLHI